MEKLLARFDEKGYSNVVGEKFVGFLKKNFADRDIDDMIRLCRLLVVIDFAV